jgi:hypothetical protein
MIEFVPGPHGETCSKKEQARITESLKPGSFAWRVNQVYNNVYHFSSHKPYDTELFLQELKYIVDSKHHKIQVMGGLHTDPYGHTSGMIGQYEDYSGYGEFFPAITKDTYIRFKIVQDQKWFKVLRVLDHFSVFHFLMQVPYIERLQLHHTTPVYMQEPPSGDLVPTSRYAKNAILFVQ